MTMSTTCRTSRSAARLTASAHVAEKVANADYEPILVQGEGYRRPRIKWPVNTTGILGTVYVFLLRPGFADRRDFSLLTKIFSPAGLPVTPERIPLIA